MSEIGFVSVGTHNADSFRTSDALEAWTGVRAVWDGETWDASASEFGEEPRLVRSGDEIGFAGDASGRVLQVKVAFGQAASSDPAHLWDSQAQRLLAAIQGDAYSPFEAQNAVIDPAAEIGDAVSLPDGALSMIFSMSGELDGLCAVDISAPTDEAVDSAYPSGVFEDGFSNSEGSGGMNAAELAEMLPDALSDAFEQTLAETLPELLPEALAEALPDAWEDVLLEALPEALADALPEALPGALAEALPELLPDALGETLIEKLYGFGGLTADLIVNSLSTTQAVRKYLAGDASEDRRVDIREEKIAFVAGLSPSGDKQATNPFGEPLYWASDPRGEGVTTGSDGYPYLNGKRVLITTDRTEWPVSVYGYADQTKLKIAFELEGADSDGNPIYTPTITLGAGNADGYNQAVIRKGAEGLEILYTANTGGVTGLRFTTDGRMTLLGGGASTLISLDGTAQGTNSKVSYNPDVGVTEISGFVHVIANVDELPEGHENMDTIFVVRR